MKKSDLITIILFAVIVGYSFNNSSTYKVFGQTSSSSSSSSGSTTSSSSSSGSEATSSSSGSTTSSSSSSGSVTTSSSSGSTTSTSSSSGSTATSSSSGSTETSSSSSSGSVENGSSSSGSTTTPGGPLSENFTGIWRAEVERTVTVNGVAISKGSRIITTKLCLDNGVLKGFVEQPGLLARGVITSQNVISSNEVELQLQDINGRTSSVHFTLTDGKLNGVFSNGITFSSVKQTLLNPGRVCIDLGILPQTSSSTSSSSSTSTGGTSTLSTKFNGLWQAKLDREIQINGVTVKQGSRVISLRLCSNNGNLTGVIEHPGFFTRGVITSFEVVSETEVTANFTDRRGRTGSVQLIINGSELNGKFSNGVVFAAINRFSANPSRACIGLGTVPTTSSSSGS